MSTITIISKQTKAEAAPIAQEIGGVPMQTPPDAEVIPALQETEEVQENAPLDIEEVPMTQENGDVQEQSLLDAEQRQTPNSTPPQEETYEQVAPNENATSQEHSPSPKRKRKTKEERLQVALAKQAVLDTKIAGLKKELDDTAKKARNRGLILVGIVVEQCFKENAFTAENKTWWMEQAKFLPEKDKVAYLKFLKTINIMLSFYVITL